MNPMGEVTEMRIENVVGETCSLVVVGIHRHDAALILSRLAMSGRVFGEPWGERAAHAQPTLTVTAKQCPPAAMTVTPAAVERAQDVAKAADIALAITPATLFAPEVSAKAPTPSPAPVVEVGPADKPEVLAHDELTIADVTNAVQKKIGAPVQLQTVAQWPASQRAAAYAWATTGGPLPTVVEALLPAKPGDVWGLAPPGEDVDDVAPRVAPAPSASAARYNIDALKASTRVVDVVKALHEAGLATLDLLVQECEMLKPQIAVLSRVPNMRERVLRTLEVANIKVS